MVGLQETIEIIEQLKVIKNQQYALLKEEKILENPLNKYGLKYIVPLIFIIAFLVGKNIRGILLFFFIIGWIIPYILIGLHQKKKNEFHSIKQDLEEQKDTLLEQYTSLEQQLEKSIVPEQYRTLEIMQELLKNIDSGRAESLKESIYFYELDTLKRSIDKQNEEIQTLQNELKKERKKNKELKKEVESAKLSASIARTRYWCSKK